MKTLYKFTHLIKPVRSVMQNGQLGPLLINVHTILHEYIFISLSLCSVDSSSRIKQIPRSTQVVFFVND